MNHIFLKKQGGSVSWVYDSINLEYTLTIDGNVVATVDSDGNLKIKGRVLKS